jgi:O-antigen/teichoic acid export membrane protein
MIKEMLDAKQVGLYAAAVRLSEAWYFIPMVITSSVFPVIINAKKKSDALYYRRLQNLYDLMVWLAVAIALPTSLLAPWVIRVLYGDVFLPAAGALSIHVWAGVFVFFGVARGKWLIVENLQRKSFQYIALGGLVNIVLNSYLIPLYGINGAAIATLGGQFVAAYFAALFFKITRKSCFMFNRSFLPLHYFIRQK